eukprot:SAG31_NODE_4272_length_3388_cov_6.008209_3_plen_92_part_00
MYTINQTSVPLPRGGELGAKAGRGSRQSQGQTLARVGLDFRLNTFAHGQSYVGFGRVRNSDSIMVLHHTASRVNGDVHVTNITYASILAYL